MNLEGFRLGVVRERGSRWMVISVAIHAVLLGLLLLFKPAPRPTIQYIELDDGGRDRGLVFHPPTGVPVQEPRPTPRVAFERPAPSASPDAPLAAPTRIARPALDSIPAVTRGPVGARYGDGRLWVSVDDVLKGNLPAKRDVKEMPSHVALVDSALAEKIRSYLDTVPPDSFVTRQAPKWTAEVDGQTWGIDGQWIYLGPIRIPTAILALLPLPQGNYELAQRNIQLQRMREEIMEAARRSSDAVEFKRYVKELRERKDREHQQRIPPKDPAPRDTLIPYRRPRGGPLPPSFPPTTASRAPVPRPSVR